MPAYTDEQAAAIASRDRPLQIIACAGSGKTQVISQRIATLLSRPDVTPANIVAFTFTEKAAAELNERVHGIVEAEQGAVVGLQLRSLAPTGFRRFQARTVSVHCH